MSPPRVALIGARRARQGLGPFVARDLAGAGVEVPCFLVTNEASLDAAREGLRRYAGLEPRGYVDLDAMLAAESLDALAICSPHETHLRYLEAALDAGLHALCEKPLVWDVADVPATTARVTERFRERGLVLRENCPWPFVLDALAKLHPGALDDAPERFRMGLQPAGHGVRMLADALPHPLSLLQVLAPGADPSVNDVDFSSTSADSDRVLVTFGYGAGEHRVSVEVSLERSDEHPRRVWLEIDGRHADRVVSPPDYRLSLRDGERSVPLDDPMTRLVAAFATEISGAGPDPDAGRAIADRSALLAGIADAWHAAATRGRP